MPKPRGAKAEAIRTTVLAMLQSGKPLETRDHKQEESKTQGIALNLLQKEKKYANELAEHSKNLLTLSSKQVRARRDFLAQGQIEFSYTRCDLLNTVRRFDSYPCD